MSCIGTTSARSHTILCSFLPASHVQLADLVSLAAANSVELVEVLHDEHDRPRNHGLDHRVGGTGDNAGTSTYGSDFDHVVGYGWRVAGRSDLPGDRHVRRRAACRFCDGRGGSAGRTAGLCVRHPIVHRGPAAAGLPLIPKRPYGRFESETGAHV